MFCFFFVSVLSFFFRLCSFRRFISSQPSSIFLNFNFPLLFSWFTCTPSAFFKIQVSSIKTQL
jgi:hypothetical protein